MYETPFHSKSLDRYSFLITGGAGFIGSHLVEYLLKYGARKVQVLDNLLTGLPANVDMFRSNDRFEFINGDIRDEQICLEACDGIDYVLHEAALGSVQRSIEDPILTHSINATGFLNVIRAAKEKGVRRFVYASSSSVYGDHPALPKKEDHIGQPLSPYAVSKHSNELYAHVFASNYGMQVIGLRYFNVFGPRQNPEGPYAAVIPAFIRDIRNGNAPVIYGNGSQSRDFTPVENVVQANIKALFAEDPESLDQVYNIAFGSQYTVLQLFEIIRKISGANLSPKYEDSRKGDIVHSHADISKAERLLGYRPSIDLEHGLETLISR